MFPCLLLSLTPLAGASPLPSVYIPSFTSGFMPLEYPSYLRNKVGKREDSEPSAYVDSWHFGKKRSPWTGAWANIVWRPEDVDPKKPEKRGPQPSMREHYRIILMDCVSQISIFVFRRRKNYFYSAGQAHNWQFSLFYQIPLQYKIYLDNFETKF